MIVICIYQIKYNIIKIILLFFFLFKNVATRKLKIIHIDCIFALLFLSNSADLVSRKPVFGFLVI